MLNNKKVLPQKPKGFVYIAGKKVKIESSEKPSKNWRKNTIKAIEELKKKSIFMSPKILDEK